MLGMVVSRPMWQTLFQHFKAARIAFATLCVILLGLAASNATAQALPTVRIVPDPSGQGGRVAASLMIEAPPSVVWAVMVDCENAPRYVPNLRSCTVESRAPDGASDVRYHRIAWLAGFPPVNIRFVSTYKMNREIRFERLSGDITAMSGVWRMEPSQNGRATNLSYEAHLVPSRLLPAGLVRSALKRDTPKILEAVRREAIRRAALPQ
jgi:ribosome-associated toxin RatA of RatAB toxin-antitoxin module